MWMGVHDWAENEGEWFNKFRTSLALAAVFASRGYRRLRPFFRISWGVAR